MKETYYWVPWFRELSKKIAEFPDSNRREFLETIRKIKWGDDGKVVGQLQEHNENFDPFSFLYTVASKNGMNSREEVYDSISEVFNLRQSLENSKVDHFIRNPSIFPTPTPRNLLFWSGNNPDSSNTNVLWSLFKSTVKGLSAIDPENFSDALKIPGVGVQKLTQSFCLINAAEFLPADSSLESLKLDAFGKVPGTSQKHNFSLDKYKEILNSVRNIFLSCELFEIGLFAYVLSTQADSFRNNLSNFFQIGTDVLNNGNDRWQTFSDDNCVFTGGSFTQLLEAVEGSIVFARIGETQIYGIGVVSDNEYRRFGGWAEDRNIHVIWINKHQTELLYRSGLRRGFSRLDNLDNIRTVEPYRLTLEQLTRINPPPASSSTSKLHPLNRILYGPPGTGKTWHTVNLSLSIVLEKEVEDVNDEDREEFNRNQFNIRDGSGQIAFTTFHQNYAYEDFVEGIRPTVEGGEVGYEIRDGIFKNLANAAKNNPNQPYVLIIDEINRGNVAKIFGELITLIEDTKRLGEPDEKEVILPYSQASFGVPPNLYIIGTMNTADRSIQILDTALRRRFTFLEMMPETSHERIPTDINGINCQKILESMNRRIFSLLDRERQIGHTYFFGIPTIEKLADAFQIRIIPLLQEYFFDDWSKIRVVLGGNKFVQERSIDDRSIDEYRDSENKVYERLAVEDEGWTNPENYIQIYQNK